MSGLEFALSGSGVEQLLEHRAHHRTAHVLPGPQSDGDEGLVDKHAQSIECRAPALSRSSKEQRARGVGHDVGDNGGGLDGAHVDVRHDAVMGMEANRRGIDQHASAVRHMECGRPRQVPAGGRGAGVDEVGEGLTPLGGPVDDGDAQGAGQRGLDGYRSRSTASTEDDDMLASGIGHGTKGCDKSLSIGVLADQPSVADDDGVHGTDDRRGVGELIEVLQHLDELADSAAIIGAVNTVIIRDGRLIGENTDGQGFVASLRTVADPAGQHVVVLGAGGAARAIAVETALAGALSITIVNRTPERGEALADLIDTSTPAAGRYLPWTPALHVPHGTGVLINATSIGFHPHHGVMPDVDMSTVEPTTVVADVVANPPRTLFLAAAAERGCPTLDGLGMLVNQALIAVRLWTGQDVSGAVMRTVLEELFDA